MDERYIAAVDLGTSKIAVTVAKVNRDDVQVIYYKEKASEGVRYSAVYNPVLVSTQVKAALQEAEENLRIKILQIVVGLPRFAVRQESACACLDRSGNESSISLEEVSFLKNNAIDSYPLANEVAETIYGIVPQSFSVDEYIQQLESQIVGMVGNSLEGNFKIFVGSRRASSNVDMAMNITGKATAKKFFLPETTAKAVLTNEEMENGVALVEIGAGATSVTIYHKTILRYYSSIPFGGSNITNDIRRECGTSEKLAENIKLAYGACMPEKLLTLREKIIQIENKVSGNRMQLSVKYLSEIITARTREIVEAVLYMIQESGFSANLPSGVVVTGGGANLPNLSSFIKDLSGYNVRLGFPLRHKFSFAGCSGAADTQAAASIGMILAAKEDVHLNCLSGPVVIKEEIEDEEEDEEFDVSDTVKTVPAAQDTVPAAATSVGTKDSLFSEEEQGPVGIDRKKLEQAAREEKKRLKREQKEKEKKEREEKLKNSLSWRTVKSVGSKIGGLFNDIYDSIDNQ